MVGFDSSKSTPGLAIRYEQLAENVCKSRSAPKAGRGCSESGGGISEKDE
jgi:hypothetical protein